MGQKWPRRRDVATTVNRLVEHQRQDDIHSLDTGGGVSGFPPDFPWRLVAFPAEYGPGAFPRFYGGGGYNSPDNAVANPQSGDDGYWLHLRGRLNVGNYDASPLGDPIGSWANGGPIFTVPGLPGRVLSNQPRLIRVPIFKLGGGLTAGGITLTTTPTTLGYPTAGVDSVMTLTVGLQLDSAPPATSQYEVFLDAYYNTRTNEDTWGEFRMAWS